MDLFHKLIYHYPALATLSALFTIIALIFGFIKWGVKWLRQLFKHFTLKSITSNTNTGQVKIVPWIRGDTEAWWHMGEMENKPAMQIVSYWYVTNTSDQPVLLLNAYMKHSVIKMISVQHPEQNVFGSYPILPTCTSEVVIDFWIQPPRCKEGEEFKSDITITDQLGQTFKMKKVIFKYK